MWRIIDHPLSFGSSLCYWNSSSGLLAPISLLVCVHQSGDNSTYHSQPSDLFGQRHPEDQTFVVPTVVIDGSPGTITEEANVGRRSHDVHVFLKKCYPSPASIYPTFSHTGGQLQRFWILTAINGPVIFIEPRTALLNHNSLVWVACRMQLFLMSVAFNRRESLVSLRAGCWPHPNGWSDLFRMKLGDRRARGLQFNLEKMDLDIPRGEYQ